jgi:hypothetical protein
VPPTPASAPIHTLAYWLAETGPVLALTIHAILNTAKVAKIQLDLFDPLQALLYQLQLFMTEYIIVPSPIVCIIKHSHLSIVLFLYRNF